MYIYAWKVGTWTHINPSNTEVLYAEFIYGA